MNEKLAKLLRTTPDVFRGLPQDILDHVLEKNEMLVDRTLQEFGLQRTCSAEEITHALTQKLAYTDEHLKKFLHGDPFYIVRKILGVPTGFFIKKEKALQLINRFLPQAHVNAQNLTSVLCSLRFMQDDAWMHRFFEEGYATLTADDFEERPIEFKLLEQHWLDAAKKFTTHKLHNVSHLKEHGIIFISPEAVEEPGETLRNFMLMLHYLHEVPYYSRLFRRFSKDADFVYKLQSLLRGDVSEQRIPNNEQRITIRIVQRYLAKDDLRDWRLLEPHVNPEAEHWYLAEGDLAKLREMTDELGTSLGFWQGLDFVGDFFRSEHGEEKLISFDFIDLDMTLVAEAAQRRKRFYYHQQEALWNKIFSSYLGRDKLQQLIEDNIIKGFIEL